MIVTRLFVLLVMAAIVFIGVPSTSTRKPRQGRPKKHPLWKVSEKHTAFEEEATNAGPADQDESANNDRMPEEDDGLLPDGSRIPVSKTADEKGETRKRLTFEETAPFENTAAPRRSRRDAQTKSPCPENQYLEGIERGRITWEADLPGLSAGYQCSWFISVPYLFSVVLQFEDVKLVLGESRDTDDALELEDVSRGIALRTVTGDGPVEAVVRSYGLIMFTLRASWKYYLAPMPKFSLSFTTYHEEAFSPMSLENCSALQQTVPEELQCDGFSQCKMCEDELDYNCSSTNIGCDEGWVAAESLCLKVVFPTIQISPGQAKSICRERYNAQLGSLSHRSARRLAVVLLNRSKSDELIVGLERVQTNVSGLDQLYRFLWRWTQAGTVFDEPVTQVLSAKRLDCAVLTPQDLLKQVDCDTEAEYGYVCSRPNPQRMPSFQRETLRLRTPTRERSPLLYKDCKEGHFVQHIHPCLTSTVASTLDVSLLQCKNGRQLHYTVACDGFDDCGDESDEENCDDVRSDVLMASSFMCTRQAELVDRLLRCNGIPDCHDGSDEENCAVCRQGTTFCEGFGCIPQSYITSGEVICSTSSLEHRPIDKLSLSHGGLVHLDGRGMAITLAQPEQSSECPETHFLCERTTQKLCIPSFLVGNGLPDCPAATGLKGSEDEPPEAIECPGYYQCYRHRMCVHPDFLCDGVYHCPLKDDERYCSRSCPMACICSGHEYVCGLSANMPHIPELTMFDLDDHPHVRYLDLSGFSRPSLEKLHCLGYLHFLSLSSCGLDRVSFGNLVHLKVLDLSSNSLSSLSHLDFKGLQALTHLNLADNPLMTALGVHFEKFLSTSGIVSLQWLVLWNTGIQSIDSYPFSTMGGDMFLDLTGNQIDSGDKTLFTGWKKLQKLKTDDPGICCAYINKVSQSADCSTPKGKIVKEHCKASALEDTARPGTSSETSGCDSGWLSHESSCFRFVFPVKYVSPTAAITDCRERFRAGPAALPSVNLRRLAWSFAKRRGYDSLIVGLEKVQTSYKGLAHLYRFLWQWTEAGTEFDGPNLTYEEDLNCVILQESFALKQVDCLTEEQYAYVCAKRNPAHTALFSSRWALPLPSDTLPFPVKTCEDGSLVHPFHPCPYGDKTTPDRPSNHFTYLHCKNGRRVHYSLTCDGFDDCGDKSDEESCQNMPSELLLESAFMCTRQAEMVHKSYICDGMPDCHDGSDEETCDYYSCANGTVYCVKFGCLPPTYTHIRELACHNEGSAPPGFWGRRRRSESFQDSVTPPSAIKMTRRVDLDGYGSATVTAVETCPETHVECDGGHCIPSFLLNNGQPDCVSAEDETSQSVSCPGHYRCYRHDICVHPNYVCDGVHHCPLKDDERYCNPSCPPSCTCEGLAFTCRKMFDPTDYLYTRYLDLSGSFQPPLDKIHDMGYIHFLNLSACGLTTLPFFGLFHLKVLDLSSNYLLTLAFGSLPSLSQLILSNNPLPELVGARFGDFLAAAKITNLHSLGLRGTGIEYIAEDAFVNLTSLVHLDLRENEIRSINRGMFLGLTELKVMETDDARLCCPYFYLYPNATMDCRTPMDELSSCSELLRSHIFRAFLWTFSVMAISGNIGVLIYRVFLESEGSSSVFQMLVANLCVADFLMGVYMMIIGAADAYYSGQYIWKQETWTRSGPCQAAGFLALLSSEASALIICLITLDRLLVLRFPLSRHVHMGVRSSALACVGIWVVGLSLASVPLLPREWTFYGQTGICLPLPITRKPFPGQQYAFGVFVALNFLLFLLISAGQLLIYHAIRRPTTASRTHRRQLDVAIARRLFLVVFSDFCCWFPVGLMGLLAYRGTPIPGEVNVLAAIFILPVNSAINPFLYTINTMLERRRQRLEEQRIQRTINKLHGELITWSPDKVRQLFTDCERVLARLQAKPPRERISEKSVSMSSEGTTSTSNET